jgi:hypothetical protein
VFVKMDYTVRSSAYPSWIGAFETITTVFYGLDEAQGSFGAPGITYNDPPRIKDYGGTYNSWSGNVFMYHWSPANQETPFLIRMDVCPDGYPTPYPSPSPTGTQLVSDCSVVDPGDVCEDWTCGMLPIIVIGPPVCTGWPELVFDISILNLIPGFPEEWEIITIPAVQICLRGIYFGSVTLFRMVISYDLILGLFCGVLVFRFVFRS